MKNHLKPLLRLFGNILVYLLLTIIGSTFGGLLVDALVSGLGISKTAAQNLPVSLLLIIPQALITLFVLWGWLIFIEKKSIRSLGLPKGGTLRSVLKGWLLALLVDGLLIGSFVLTGVIQLKSVNATPVFLGSLLLVLIAAHFQGGYEEIVNRGWYFPTLSRDYGRWTGLAVSAISFGLLHISFLQYPLLILNIMLFAAFCCLYVWETGKVWGTIGFHSFSNFLLVGVFTLKSTAAGVQSFGLFIFEDKSNTLATGFMGSWPCSLLYSILIAFMIVRRLKKSRARVQSNSKIS